MVPVEVRWRFISLGVYSSSSSFESNMIAVLPPTSKMKAIVSYFQMIFSPSHIAATTLLKTIEIPIVVEKRTIPQKGNAIKLSTLPMKTLMKPIHQVHKQYALTF